MAHLRDSFCSFCGTRFDSVASYPRSCSGCGATVWANPTPVCVVLVPVRRGERSGLLVIRRSIEPHPGKLALVGGFLEAHETWAEGAAREVLEETNVRLDPSSLTPQWFASTSPKPSQVLLFSLSQELDASALGPYVANSEASERGLVFGPGQLETVFAFPLHVEAARRFFASRGVDGPHGYQPI